ncbi:MAG TPA: NUDIX hydrolase [Acidimicrobiales bacterium]|nr:NUDIX hydrolase [Acidimicrobiales bacterium]
MRHWVVASGLVEGDDGLLLVQNLRRNGSLDWSTPGGVIEIADGEDIVDGLTREVAEETGIVVNEWIGPIYQVEAVAEGLGWALRAEIYRAAGWTGSVVVEDPDGIVVDARFVPVDACDRYLEGCHPWVREPLGAWLVERWEENRHYRYRLDGDAPGSITVVKV